MNMKLTELLNDIVEQKINEAYTTADLKNLGTKIKQGITNLGNKPMDVDFSGTNKTGLERGKLATKRIEDLGREIGFEVPQSDKYTLLSEKYEIKVLGPFNSLATIPNFSYLKVKSNDMNTLEGIKSYFGNNYIQDPNNYDSISIKNFKKYKSNNEFIYIYDKNNDGLIVYYSKKPTTNIYLSTNLNPTPNGYDLTQNDITTLSKLLKISNNEVIDPKEFKKVSITIL